MTKYEDGKIYGDLTLSWRNQACRIGSQNPSPLTKPHE